MHHEQMMNNNSRRSSDPYEHEGIFHRVQPKNSHPSPYAHHSENNGFHPVEQRGSPATVKQEDEVRGAGGSGGMNTGFHRSPENHHTSAEAVEKKAPADERPSSREVDEDYDETAADTLMSMAQTGGRKRSLDRHDEVANVDSDSKRPKPAAEPEHEQPTAAAPHQEEPQQESENQVVSEVEKTSVVAEQQSEAPPAAIEEAAQQEDETKDEPMEEVSSSAPEPTAVIDQAPVEEPSPKEDLQAEAKPSSPPSEQPDAAEEGEADPEKEEGETDAAEPSKDEQDAAELSEPEAGEVTPSPEATTA
jgi:hypothetical protein